MTTVKQKALAKDEGRLRRSPTRLGLSSLLARNVGHYSGHLGGEAALHRARR
ncbi:MAG: hypothetical protein K8W52_43615 [Deltaproteobacteria bacterium]|nr:hypothetical protein [Deltaproteobacteria bacterium]